MALKSFFTIFLYVNGYYLLFTNGMDVNANDRISAAIIKQAEHCPYIPLCTRTNSSIFTQPKYGLTVPCCQKCTCDDTCKSRGSCCPDYYEKGSDLDLISTPAPSYNSTDENGICIKTVFGNIPNSKGFIMIASCPNDYEDDVTKSHCEIKFDLSNVQTFVNNIPVFDRGTGLTYKNHYCAICNRANISANVPWDVWFECGATQFFFEYKIFRSLLELAAVSILQQKRQCNIAFRLNENKENVTEPRPCKIDDTINTCNDNFENTEIETLCNSYFWPITTKSGAVKYKNYHCMLCNGQQFKDNCLSSVTIDFAVSLMLNTTNKQTSHGYFDKTTNFGDTTNYNSIFRDQIINKASLDKSTLGNCPKGFLYDKKMRRCRIVMCPLNFYVDNEVCVPMFNKMTGIFYTVHLELLVPPSISQAQQADFEKSLSSSLCRILDMQVGKSKYKFYLWSSQTLAGNVNIKQPYLISLAIDGNVYEGNYYLALEFVSNLVFHIKQVNVSLHIGGKVTVQDIGFRFSSSTYWTNMKPFDHGIRYRIVYSNTKFESQLLGVENATEMKILEISLCFRTVLYDDEFKLFTKSRIRIFNTNVSLAVPSYSSIKENGDIKPITCLERVFKPIQISHSNGFIKHKINPRLDYQSETGSSLTRSFVATLSSIGLVVLIVCKGHIRGRMLKKQIISKNANGNTGNSIEDDNIFISFRKSLNSPEVSRSNQNENDNKLKAENYEECFVNIHLSVSEGSQSESPQITNNDDSTVNPQQGQKRIFSSNP